MTKPKPKRQTTSRSDRSKSVGRNGAAQTTARKTTKFKVGKQSAVIQRQQTFAEQPGHSESKQARIIAMLRMPNGTTIDEMVRATGWQQHSVRGFLAGVIRKKLSLNLVSAAAEGGRIYRIADRTTSRVVAVKTNRAA